MVAMSDDDTKRVHLRNVSGTAWVLHESAHPRPALVPAGGVVEVDEHAAAGFLEGGDFKRATKADARAAESSAAARVDELLDDVDTPPAASQPDTTDNGES